MRRRSTPSKHSPLKDSGADRHYRSSTRRSECGRCSQPAAAADLDLALRAERRLLALLFGKSSPIARYRSGSSSQFARTLTNRKRCTGASWASAISLRAAEPIALMRAPAFADDDLLVALARDVDRLLDPRRAVGLVLPRFGLDRSLIGQLVVQPLEQLLAGDFGGERAQRRVGDLSSG